MNFTPKQKSKASTDANPLTDRDDRQNDFSSVGGDARCCVSAPSRNVTGAFIKRIIEAALVVLMAMCPVAHDSLRSPDSTKTDHDPERNDAREQAANRELAKNFAAALEEAKAQGRPFVLPWRVEPEANRLRWEAEYQCGCNGRPIE
jgi:hypothetical protein